MYNIIHLDQIYHPSPAVPFLPILTPCSALSMSMAMEPSTQAWAVFQSHSSLKKADSFSLGSQQLQIAPQLRVGLHESLSHSHWNFAWLGLVQVLCLKPQSL